MHLPGRTYAGAVLDDLEILESLPPEYAQLLAQRNGFVAFGGALHVRGACTAPAWHAIRTAMEGPDALFLLFPAVDRADAPFGQDALGNQFIIRNGGVYRLAAAIGAVQVVEFIAPGVAAFLTRCLEEPADVLPLDAIAALHAAGSKLEPGELLDATAPRPRPVPALERIRRLAGR